MSKPIPSHSYREAYGALFNEISSLAGSVNRIPDQLGIDLKFIADQHAKLMKNLTDACKRNAALQIFNQFPDVEQVRIRADWNGCEDDDHPWIYIEPLDGNGQYHEKSEAFHENLEGDIENLVWGILGKYDMEQYFANTAIYRDGRMEPVVGRNLRAPRG